MQRAGDDLISLDDDELGRAEPAIIHDILATAPSLAAIGDLQRVEQLLRKGVRTLSINPRATQVDLIVPLYNLMAVYDQTGHYDLRTQVGTAIGSIAERLDEPLTSSAATALLQFGRLLKESENINSTLVMYRSVHRYMTTSPDIEPESLISWLQTYTQALLAGERYTEVITVCGEALEIADSGKEIEFLGALANAAARTQAIATAEDALERAVALAEAMESSGGFADRRTEAAAGAAYHNLAVHLATHKQADRDERSEYLMQRALAIVLRQGGAGSAEHAGALGQLAVITEARGDLDAADRLYAESIDIYETAVDTDRVEFSNFATDLGLMRLRRGRPSDAVAPLRRAAELRDGASAETPLRRADAASNLATAYFESGDLAAASLEYTRALDLRFAVSTRDDEV